jgi:hypothetical protein
MAVPFRPLAMATVVLAAAVFVIFSGARGFLARFALFNGKLVADAHANLGHLPVSSLPDASNISS